MHRHPALSEALVRDRAVELRRSGMSSLRDPRMHQTDHVSGAARRRTGWLLVEVGLWLAVPRSAMSRPGARGER